MKAKEIETMKAKEKKAVCACFLLYCSRYLLVVEGMDRLVC